MPAQRYRWPTGLLLLELNAAPGGRLQMQELANRVVLSRTRVSRLVDEMVQADLVSKVRDETDRRVVWATITRRGTQDLRRTAPHYLRGIETYFSSCLTQREKAVVATALTKVTTAHADVTDRRKGPGAKPSAAGRSSR